MLLVGVAFTNTQGKGTGNFMASPTKEIKRPLPQPNSDCKEAITAFFEKRPADFTWSRKAAVA